MHIFCQIGNRVHLQVIQSGSSSGLQNKYEPKEQYVTRRNEVAYRGQEKKLWCIYGGTPLPEIRWRKKGMLIITNEYINSRI